MKMDTNKRDKIDGSVLYNDYVASWYSYGKTL
jgi:hypothetical protein